MSTAQLAPPDDSVLVRAVLAGDVDLYGALVNRYAAEYMRFAVRMFGTVEDADEVLHTAFYRAYQHLDSCQDPRRFGAWLYRIVVNECRTRASRRGRRERRLVRDEATLAGLPANDRADGQLALREELQRAIGQLPVESREAFVLKYVEELSYEEMSEITGAGMRGESPAAIERAVVDHSARLAQSQTTLSTARGGRPASDEVEASAEAMRQGVDGATVSALAKSAPSGRSLAVPLYVLGQLAARGLPSDDALSRVKERLAARASDAELEQLPAQAIAGRENRPAEVGRELARTRRPANVGGGAGTAGGPPAGVPANAGAGARPTGAGRPATPGRP